SCSLVIMTMIASGSGALAVAPVPVWVAPVCAAFWPAVPIVELVPAVLVPAVPVVGARVVPVTDPVALAFC
ncbi:hypothetical protein, partial [Microvirga pakistanensis]|uniref:hypothetical protein n=1 Tax=Microvirga pakistanensis TaxID=1682650 RepID=UPI00195D6969